MASPSRPAAFFDRDGVLNVNHEYVGTIDRWEWVEGAREAIAMLNKLGYWVFVVTNQSGIARGMYREEEFHSLMSWVRNDLAEAGGQFDAVFFCPHGPDDGCDCRKPLPGMIEKAFTQFSIDRNRSFLIGDSPTDMQAAMAARIPGYLFEGGSLLARVEEILAGR